MQKTFKIYIYIFFTLLINPLYANNEYNQFKKIESLYNSLQYKDAQKKSYSFFRKYPKSKYVADLRLMLADSENNPEKKINDLKRFLNIYKYYNKKDLVYIKLCRLYSLLGHWKDLDITSYNAIKSFNNSIYIEEFKNFNTSANLNLQEYIDNKKINTKNLTVKDAYSEYKLDGNYTNFFNKLKTIIIRNYQEAPAALYILSENEYDKNSTIAYSALIDLKKKYPRSPESLLANEKLNHFKRNVAYKKNYLNIKAVSNSFPDISPTIDLSGNERLQKDSEIKYSISIGPFYNLKTAIKLRKMLRKEFKKVFIIKTNKEFTLNVGEITNIREANNFQIRISEEYGLKGKIINLQSNKNKVYLYN